MTDEQSQRINRIFRDLTDSATHDIASIIQPGNPEGGYFGVPRVVLCYVQFLGLLFNGWNGNKTDGEKKNFGTSGQAKKFIKKVLALVDPLYRDYGDLLYDMYRHGTVHIISPKKMVSKLDKSKTIEWLIYKGDREQWDYYENKSAKLRHLQVVEWKKERFVMPVSIVCLYRDLLIVLDLYRRMIYQDTSGKLLKNFLSVVDALDADFDETPLNFWEKAIKLNDN